MSRKDKYDFDLREPLECLLLSDARITHAPQRPEERSWLGRQVRRGLRGAAPAFAVIGFGKVCQFEIDGKRFRHLMRLGNIQTTHDSLRTFDQPLLVSNIIS